uniref:Secreted protein n=1 Tax=Panstrongylus lignarius TaxID=156445 RepID=A0A224XWX9_9HEMI
MDALLMPTMVQLLLQLVLLFLVWLHCQGIPVGFRSKKSLWVLLALILVELIVHVPVQVSSSETLLVLRLGLLVISI